MIDDILEGVKAIKNIAEVTQNLELKNLIIDLKEQITNLREENLLLKSKLSQKEAFNMIFEKNAYFNIKEDGTKDGPFCSGCWDNDNVAIRLVPFSIMGLPFTHNCPKCKNKITIR